MKARRPYISIIILIISFFVTRSTFAEPKLLGEPYIDVAGVPIGEDGSDLRLSGPEKFLRNNFSVASGYTDYQWTKAGGPFINKILGGAREGLWVTALGLYLHGKDRKRKHRGFYKKNKKLALQLLAATVPLSFLEGGILEYRTRNIPERPPKELMDKVIKEYEEKQHQLEERYKNSLNSYRNEYINATYEPVTNLGRYGIVKIE